MKDITVVDDGQVRDFSNQIKAIFTKTSAKTEDGLKGLFNLIEKELFGEIGGNAKNNKKGGSKKSNCYCHY